MDLQPTAKHGGVPADWIVLGLPVPRRIVSAVSRQFIHRSGTNHEGSYATDNGGGRANGIEDSSSTFEHIISVNDICKDRRSSVLAHKVRT